MPAFHVVDCKLIFRRATCVFFSPELLNLRKKCKGEAKVPRGLSHHCELSGETLLPSSPALTQVRETNLFFSLFSEGVSLGNFTWKVLSLQGPSFTLRLKDPSPSPQGCSNPSPAWKEDALSNTRSQSTSGFCFPPIFSFFPSSLLSFSPSTFL